MFYTKLGYHHQAELTDPLKIFIEDDGYPWIIVQIWNYLWFQKTSCIEDDWFLFSSSQMEIVNVPADMDDSVLEIFTLVIK